jgi:hypothetical protein
MKRQRNSTATSAVSLPLLRYCLRHRDEIRRIYGLGALPLPSATNRIRRVGDSKTRAVIDLTAPQVLRTTWGRDWKSIMFIRKMLVFVFREPKRLRAMVIDPQLLYALRLLGYIFTTMFVPDNPARKHPVVLAMRYLTMALNPVHRRKIAPYITSNGCPKAINTLPSYSRYTFLHKFLTPMKRQLGESINNIITKRWIDADEVPRYLYCGVNPGPNYALQTALSEYAINKAVDLNLRDIVILLQYMSEFISTDCRDANLLHLFHNLRTILNARFQAKVIEINERDCTCHAKCMGMIGDNETLKQFYTTALRSRASTVVSAIGRLSHKVDNTTSQKPKRYLHSHAPTIATCSGDGASTLRLISLYRLEKVTGYNDGRFLYTHRFYSSNSTVFTDEIYRNLPTSSTARIYGMCFSGQRKCHKMLTDVVHSAKQVTRKAPLDDVCAWYRCRKCANVEHYDNSDHFGPHEAIHTDTCIDAIVAQVRYKKISYPEAALRMCDGCVASFMCHHMLDGFTKNYSSAENLLLIVLRLRVALRQTRLRCRNNEN